VGTGVENLRGDMKNDWEVKSFYKSIVTYSFGQTSSSLHHLISREVGNVYFYVYEREKA
jgi:hypothetical protein